MYTMKVLYFFLFILLNLTLLLEEFNGEENEEVFLLIKQAQDIVIYLLISVTILKMIIDGLSLTWPKLLSLKEF